MTVAPKTRTLPHNIEAEKSVIGALLIENAGYALVAGWLDRSMFFRDAHRKIYGACCDVLDSGKPLDLRMLCEELTRRGLLDDVGGPAYVASLVDGVPRSTNVRHYGEIVREKRALCALIKMGGEIVEESYAAQQTPRELIERYEARLEDLAAVHGVQAGAVTLREDLPALMADYDTRVSRKGQISGFPTGFQEMDLFTHGWQRRKMIVIAGQTSFGKSILAMNATLSIARAGGRVVYYSYEMPRLALLQRLWSMIAGVPLTSILWGNVSGDAAKRLQSALDEMHDLPIEINDGTSRSVADARTELRQIRADRGLAAAVFDHFQLMEGVDGENRTQQLSNISRKLQGLGPELDITTFVLSQLTVPAAEAAREPQLDDLRECKSLGHDADAVIMLHPHEPAKVRTDQPVVIMKALIRKQRGGRVGRVWLDLERDYVRFVQGTEPAPVPRAEKKPGKGVVKSPDSW